MRHSVYGTTGTGRDRARHIQGAARRVACHARGCSRGHARVAIAAMVLCTSIAGADDDLAAALAAVRAAEQQRVETFARAAATVVAIFTDTAESGGGSGVLIDADGYGLTNFHVVQPFIASRRGFGGLADGRLYPLKVIGVDPGGDVVLFRLEGRPSFACAPLGDSDALHVGQRVAAMGNPFVLAEDYTPTITLGIISGLHRYQQGQENLLEYADCIQVSTSINPGNSGGPLFDMDGRVIGINGRASFEERGRVNVGLGYAVSINQIKRFLPGLRAGRLLEHGTLGATAGDIGDELLVSAVQAFSPAEHAGLQVGDALLSLAGRRLRTANDYNNILATLPAGWPVALTYRRGDQDFSTTTRLDRLALRLPLVWLVDLDPNHAELARIVQRYAEQAHLPLPAAVPAFKFTGWIRGGRNHDERTFAISIMPRETAGFVGTAPPGTEPPTDENVASEWGALVRPLLFRPQIDRRWELLAGDEVNGRIASVVEYRPEPERRFRWKLDFETAELLAATLGGAQPPETVSWSPADPRDFAGLRWPRIWTRIDSAGDRIVLQIDTIEIEAAAPAAPSAAESREDAP